MKAVLVHSKYFNIWEALGCAYLGAVVKKKCKDVELKFFQGYFDSDKKVVAGATNADVIGFSCMSPSYDYALKLARLVKKVNHKIYTVFGGWHPSAVPDIINEDAIDCVVIGEGDLVFSEILNGRREPIIYADPVVDFDTLPFPDRHLIKNHREIDLAQKMTGMRMTGFQSVRGCPRSCVFCAEHAVSGKSSRPRIRSPRNIVSEINQVGNEYNLEYFKFVDPTWNISEEEVVAFCEEKLRTGNYLPWECNLHAALVTKNMLKVMKDSKCYQINIGCESGSPKILKDMRKGVTIEQIRNVFLWAREVGLNRRAFFLLGMPNETEDDIRMTEKFIEKIDPDVFGVTILCPYPGSKLFSQEFSNTNWSDTDEYTNDFWCSKTLSNEKLKYWQRYLVDKFKSKVCWHNKEII